MLERVWEAVSEQRFSGKDFLPQATLEALLQADSRYEEGTTGGLATFGSGEVSLPQGQAAATPLLDVLDGQARREAASVDRHMLLSVEELEAVLGECEPNAYIDPVFERCPDKYASFVGDLFRCGVIGFSLKVAVVNGLFFVKKKNSKTSPHLGC